MSGLPYLDAAAVARLVPVARAVQLLEEALRGGLDPEETPRRPVVELPAGQLLLMPAAFGRYAGVKAATVAPGNAARGLPRIQGTYLLYDGETLAPLAVMDGIALTSLRTPAVSALAVRHLAAPDAGNLVVFGTGPQAWGHVLALREVRPLRRVTVVGRDPARTEAFAARCAALGLPAQALPTRTAPERRSTHPPTDASGTAPEGGRGHPAAGASGTTGSETEGARPAGTAPEGGSGHSAGGADAGGAMGRACGPGFRGVGPVAEEVAEAVRGADLIACCTSAREPLFPGGLVRDGAVVVAVGSHEPDARELDGDLLARSTVVVEARSAALAEAGDVLIPIGHGTITTRHLAGNLADLVDGRVRPGAGPRVFKGTGMAWQDLVVAAAAYEAWNVYEAHRET